MVVNPFDNDSQSNVEIKNQTINGGSQQFADEIINQNRNITADVHVEGNAINSNIARRDINIQYGVPQKVVDRLLKELDDKDVRLQKREGVIANFIRNYNHLVSRTDNIAKQAKIFLDKGKLEEAEKLFAQALENDLKNAKESNLKAAENAFSLAQIKVLELDYLKAKHYYQQAVQLAPENPFYLNWLGTHLYTLGEYAQAEPLCQRSLTILEKNLGKDHADIAASLNCLAEIYREQKKYEQAKTLYKRSLAILENTTNKDHVLIAAVLNNLGLLYESQGNNQQVEFLFKKSLINLKKGLSGKNNYFIADTLNNLAAFYYAQGEYIKAESFYRESLDMREKILGKNHPNVAQSLHNLAELYRTQGNYKQAKPLYQRSLEIFEKVFGKNHLQVATSLSSLGMFYYEQNKYDQAESFYLRSLTIQEKSLGKEHCEVANTLNNFAAIYYVQGIYEQAELLLKRALIIYEKVLGKDHSNTKNVKVGLEKLQAVKH